MCGIVGYVGAGQAAPVLLEGLARLEYRGYDSAGICVFGPQGLAIQKAKGRLQNLKALLEEAPLAGSLGIGHTRWATHGAPSDCNAHPHLSSCGAVAVVHNGIIENYLTLKEELAERGCRFQSETDTEVVAALVGCYYSQVRDLLKALQMTVARLEGSYALGVVCRDLPGKLYAVKKDSPLILGWGDGECFIASDAPAILGHTSRVIYPQDGDIAVLDARGIGLFDGAGHAVARPVQEIQWQIQDAELGDYPHYMLKEMLEQPKVLRDTVSSMVQSHATMSEEAIGSIRRIYVAACGSAYHVGCLAKYILEKYCRIPVEPVQASEFRYAEPILDRGTLVIAISQSGETADTLAALREADRLGARTLAIVNVMGSAIAKAAQQVIYTCAGPEIAVATTKAYSAQLAVVYGLALNFAKVLGTMSAGEIQGAYQALEQLPELVEEALSPETMARIRLLAEQYKGHNNLFFIGRNVDAMTCLEGSLKLKELSYIHAESYAAGELKHGPISLIEEGTPVVAVATVEPLLGKMLANVKEVKARGANVLCVTTQDLREEVAKSADVVITVPKGHPLVQPSINVVPLQLLSYYVALARGCDVDKPRNLAKSVTVE